MEKGEFKAGGALGLVPKMLVGLAEYEWVSTDVAIANALVQARPNCWRKEILGVNAV